VGARDFSHLLRPEIFHPVTPLTVPAAFRERDPAAGAVGGGPVETTPIEDLVARGQFRAAAVASVQALTSQPVAAATAAAYPPVADAGDHARIFALLYTRLACLCLIDAVPLAAQEAKALQDLGQAYYLDPDTGAHLMPWELRVLAIRLQTLGFGDPRRAVMSYYDLAREARTAILKAGKTGDDTAADLWRGRLGELGFRVAGALVEMDDLSGAADHLASLKESTARDGRLAMARALLWLHLGDVDAARRCVRDGKADQTGEQVVSALAHMADGSYDQALEKWKALKEEMDKNGTEDEMVGVNLAVTLLYLGRMEEVSVSRFFFLLAYTSSLSSQGRGILEELVTKGQASHTLLFNLSTMYELCTDRSKQLKIALTERVAGMEETSQGWEKTNADFKL
jgi:trafficking protein particle complex subunit 12